ncbi:MAG: hypothetical protein QJR07_15580 [Acetobacteraceae bacterium]|nr:hypothetical protein [Acetobacteraceae bacterium]
MLGDILKVNAVGFLTGPMPTQPLGRFKRPIEKPEQLRGLKYRTVGLAADLFNELGAAVVSVPGGEIVPALERGVIDGAEFNNPSSDRVLGFPDVVKVYMIQSYHQRVEASRSCSTRPNSRACRRRYGRLSGIPPRLPPPI